MQSSNTFAMAKHAHPQDSPWSQKHAEGKKKQAELKASEDLQKQDHATKQQITPPPVPRQQDEPTDMPCSTTSATQQTVQKEDQDNKTWLRTSRRIKNCVSDAQQRQNLAKYEVLHTQAAPIANFHSNALDGESLPPQPRIQLYTKKKKNARVLEFNTYDSVNNNRKMTNRILPRRLVLPPGPPTLPPNIPFVPTLVNTITEDAVSLEFVPYNEENVEQSAQEESQLRTDVFSGFDMGPRLRQLSRNVAEQPWLDGLAVVREVLTLLPVDLWTERSLRLLTQLVVPVRNDYPSVWTAYAALCDKNDFPRRVSEPEPLVEASSDDEQEDCNGEKQDDDGADRQAQSHDVPVCLPVDQPDNSTQHAGMYLATVDSHRKLFCPICFSYLCSVHGNCQQLGVWEKPAFSFQLDRISEQHPPPQHSSQQNNEKSSRVVVRDVDKNIETKDSEYESNEQQRGLCYRFFLMFDGDVERIASAMDISETTVQKIVQQEQMTEPPLGKQRAVTLSKRRGKKQKLDYADKCQPKWFHSRKRRSYYNVANYNQKWYNAFVRAYTNKQHIMFFPCEHEGLCNEENCSCIKSHHFCTLACCWGRQSPNFFRGCNCKANCGTTQCSCRGNNRECDPDLCGCSICPRTESSLPTCQNEALRNRRHSQTAIAISSVEKAGWGLFAQLPISKGDLIGEYVGEFISHEEADRRGNADDEAGLSYHFQISSDVVVDGKRLGNKIRFINDSPTRDGSNCRPRVVFVNGHQRIGIYAIRDIKTNEELYFDYGYHERPAWKTSPTKSKKRKSQPSRFSKSSAKKVVASISHSSSHLDSKKLLPSMAAGATSSTS